MKNLHFVLQYLEITQRCLVLFGKLMLDTTHRRFNLTYNKKQTMNLEHNYVNVLTIKLLDLLLLLLL